MLQKLIPSKYETKYTVAIYFIAKKWFYSLTYYPNQYDKMYQDKKEFMSKSPLHKVVWHAVFLDERLNKQYPRSSYDFYFNSK